MPDAPISEDEPKPSQARSEIEEVDNVYANNVFFENSIWDLKMIFGQLELNGPRTVDWHTAVTIPWLTAKIVAYFLQLNIAYHEAEQGHLRVPDRVLPLKPQPPPADDERAKALYDLAMKIYAETFGA